MASASWLSFSRRQQVGAWISSFAFLLEPGFCCSAWEKRMPASGPAFSHHLCPSWDIYLTGPHINPHNGSTHILPVGLSPLCSSRPKGSVNNGFGLDFYESPSVPCRWLKLVDFYVEGKKGVVKGCSLKMLSSFNKFLNYSLKNFTCKERNLLIPVG